MPMWIGPSEEQKRTAALQSSIKELENSLQTVVRNLQELQKSMKEQQETLRQVVINSSSSRVRVCFFPICLIITRASLKVFGICDLFSLECQM